MRKLRSPWADELVYWVLSPSVNERVHLERPPWADVLVHLSPWADELVHLVLPPFTDERK